MFLEDFTNQKRTSIFKDDHLPHLTRLSHSFDSPSWNYQYHIHKNETELVYISQGSGIYNINANTYDLKKGTLLIVEKSAIHSLSTTRKDPLSCWTCAISDYQLNDLNEEGFLLPSNIRPCMDAGKYETLIQSLFLQMEHYKDHPSSYSTSILDTLAQTLTILYYDIFRQNPIQERQKDSSFARDILIYINENYSNHISLKLLANEFHISSDHISHEFSKVYGISPINYVIDRRLNEAKWMLINTTDSLVSISQKIGYENPNHFSNLFQKRIGYPPLEFRKKFAPKKI